MNGLGEDEGCMKLKELYNLKYNNHSSQHNIRPTIKNLIVIVGIMALVTFLSFLFDYIGFHESNIIVAYILGVLLVARQTDGYLYGILASVIGVLTFNFFFTEPHYTFLTYRPDYPVTFAIMLGAAIITSTLTTNVKKEAALSLLSEKRTHILYQINKGLLNVRNIDQIAEVGAKDVSHLFGRSVMIATINSSDILGEPCIYAYDNDEAADIFNSPAQIQAISDAFKTGSVVQAVIDGFLSNSAYYMPVIGQSGTLGVIGISCRDKQLLSNEQVALLEAVAAQIALAVERERLWGKKHKAKIEIEGERLRGNLLHSISHDLRTPLTSILGATTTILDNYEVLEDKVKKDLLQGVYEDANWLVHSVENILSLTRIDEGRIEIKKNMEAVEEIVAEAVARVKKLMGNHTIKISIPEELIMLPMDGILIEQVIVNLLDNAIKYTPSDSTIEIKTELQDEKVVFEVSDNGNGISAEDIPNIFKRFYSSGIINDMGRRGTGLGLSICKSIITAHGGEISAFNNPSSKGVTFKFVLPGKE
jgi:two-component system, OmpR family, sensor histidine kinase KdpD